MQKGAAPGEWRLGAARSGIGQTTSEGRGLLVDRRLAVGGLVLVDDALGGGPVLLAGRVLGGRDGLLLVAGLGELAELAHGGLQTGLDGLVALVGSVVLPVALDLGLDVRHGASLFAGSGRGARLWCGERRQALHTRRETLAARRIHPK